MKTTRRSVLKGAAALLAAPAIIRPAWAADPIKIGVLSPVTGAWTVYGKAHFQGFELAVVPAANAPREPTKNIEVVGVSTLDEALEAALN